MTFQEKLKIALDNPNLAEEFNLKEVKIAGDDCILIHPNDITAKWTKENLILRSCIYRKGDLYPISLGFCKFFNFSEKPDLYPSPSNHQDWEISEKLDGSLAILSKYKGELICRTRGVSDLRIHENAEEFLKLINDNPLITDNEIINSERYTLLFEWLSLKNIIVLKPEKPELVLIGGVHHNNYTMFSNLELDNLAEKIKIRRPQKFTFNSIEEILKTCETLKGQEGFVLNYNNNQNRVKIKGAAYLAMHRLKSELSSFDKIIDLYLTLNRPDYKTFYDYIVATFDFELAGQVEDNLKKVCDLGEKAQKTLDEIRIFVSNLANLSRKEAALKIIETYKEKQLDSFAFTLLTQKPIDAKIWKKLMENLSSNENI